MNIVSETQHMKQEDYLKILDWATGDDTGVSSEGLCRFMLGLEPNRWGFSAPFDLSSHDLLTLSSNSSRVGILWGKII